MSQPYLHSASAETHPQLYSSLLPQRRSAGEGGDLRRGITTPSQVQNTQCFLRLTVSSPQQCHEGVSKHVWLADHALASGVLAVPLQPPRLRTGLLPLHRHASAPVSTLDPQESHTPQSYHAADGEHDGRVDEHAGHGFGHRFEEHAQLGHPQRTLTVRPLFSAGLLRCLRTRGPLNLTASCRT